MNRPLISVIIPVYNCERYLGAAIESVLAQNWRPIEIIVVDDGSTDGSAAVARRFASHLTYDFMPHGGQGCARNRGVALARGDYLAFLDADDLWVEGKLKSQMARFELEPPADAIFGYVTQFVSPDIAHDLACRIVCPAEPMPGRIPGTLLIRRAAFQRVGPFSVDLRIGEFIEWHARAVELETPMALIPEVLLQRRIHASNSGVALREARLDYVRVIKAAIDRRRQKLREAR